MCVPPGRKLGQRWLFSLRAASRVVSGTGLPPDGRHSLETRSERAGKNDRAVRSPRTAAGRGSPANHLRRRALQVCFLQPAVRKERDLRARRRPERVGATLGARQPCRRPARQIAYPERHDTRVVVPSLKRRRRPSGDSAKPMPGLCFSGGAIAASSRNSSTGSEPPDSHHQPKRATVRITAAATITIQTTRGAGLDESGIFVAGLASSRSASAFDNRSRASPMSRRRCRGSRSRQRLISFARGAGVSAGSAPHSGSFINTAASVVETSSPSNARRAVSSSYSTTPKAQMSARLSTTLPFACSGAM